MNTRFAVGGWASWSTSTIAKDCVPSGPLLQASGGDAFFPSQVNSAGISPPGVSALDVRERLPGVVGAVWATAALATRRAAATGTRNDRLFMKHLPRVDTARSTRCKGRARSTHEIPAPPELPEPARRPRWPPREVHRVRYRPSAVRTPCLRSASRTETLKSSGESPAMTARARAARYDQVIAKNALREPLKARRLD